MKNVPVKRGWYKAYSGQNAAPAQPTSDTAIEDLFDLHHAADRLDAEPLTPAQQGLERIQQLIQDNPALETLVADYCTVVNTSARQSITEAHEKLTDALGQLGYGGMTLMVLMQEIERGAASYRKSPIHGQLQNQVAQTGEEIYRLAEQENPYSTKAANDRNDRSNHTPPRR